MYLLIISVLVTYVRTQQDACLCICCIGPACIPTQVGNFYLQSCTTQACNLQCRNSFLQCQTNGSDGQNLAQCLSTISPSYSCQCNCCRTGSTTCTPSFVGYSTSYSCQPASCTIECFKQYRNECVSDHTGQTQGICIGLITTTTTTTTTTTSTITTAVSTTIGSSSANACKCMCCQSGLNCSPNIDAGFASVSPCSSPSCTQACKNQYPSTCPTLSYLGQTNGTCANQESGNRRCHCQCCGTSGCSSYEINTNEDCTSCYTLCRQQSFCGNINTVTHTCGSNESSKSIQLSLSLTIFVSILTLFVSM